MVPSDARGDQLSHADDAGSQAQAKSNHPLALRRRPLTPGGALMR